VKSKDLVQRVEGKSADYPSLLGLKPQDESPIEGVKKAFTIPQLEREHRNNRFFLPIKQVRIRREAVCFMFYVSRFITFVAP